jgi:hypothetical protein
MSAPWRVRLRLVVTVLINRPLAFKLWMTPRRRTWSEVIGWETRAHSVDSEL